MDRIGPTKRPAGRPSQFQVWNSLLFLHWRIPAAILRPLIPAQLQIDTFEGDAFIGLVPFTMRGVRPVWSPAIPGLSNFHETNVRTYVHFEGRNPGVWFFSLDAASRLAVFIARTFWHLPYHAAQMTLRRQADGSILSQTARISAPLTRANIRYRPTGSPSSAPVGSLEHFLAERYLLYAEIQPGDLRCGQVHHQPYPLQSAEVFEWEESLIKAAGIERENSPPLAHFAAGVNVEVFKLQPLSP